MRLNSARARRRSWRAADRASEDASAGGPDSRERADSSEPDYLALSTPTIQGGSDDEFTVCSAIYQYLLSVSTGYVSIG